MSWTRKKNVMARLTKEEYQRKRHLSLQSIHGTSEPPGPSTRWVQSSALWWPLDLRPPSLVPTQNPKHIPLKQIKSEKRIGLELFNGHTIVLTNKDVARGNISMYDVFLQPKINVKARYKTEQKKGNLPCEDDKCRRRRLAPFALA